MPNESHSAVYRILDANANRAGEGFRTLEEYARFVLNDEPLTKELKTLRHELASSLGKIGRGDLLLARDTKSDVGTQIETSAEYVRLGLSSVVAAAASRTTQSLRVLEEYSKTIDQAASRRIEQVRYQFYSISGQIELTASQHFRQTRLADSQIYVLIDASEDEPTFIANVKKLTEAGADILQLRDSAQCDRTLFVRAQLGARIAREHGVLFIVNDRADLAVAADADGVHVGQDELPAEQARKIVGPNRLVGVSTHDLKQVTDAIDDGADYIGCGPVFAGTTKRFDQYVGPEFLKQVHDAPKQRPIPAFAIGGIDSSNVDQVAGAGFHRIAVTGAVRDAVDVAATIKGLRCALSS